MSVNFNLVLCLAGKGSRFTAKGYKTPKYLLEFTNNKSILENIIEELLGNKKEKIILVINDENREWSHVVETMLRTKDLSYEIYHVNDTRGQAHTAEIACKYIKNNKPIFFFNGDTILKSRNLKKISALMELNNYYGMIDTFFAKEKHFSFVRTQNKMVNEIAEKVPISNMATTGLYGFRNANLYLEFYNKIKGNFLKNEEYISEVYDAMLSDNKHIVNYHFEEKEKTIVLGTPEEYEKWIDNEG